jgi:hypothetical protein
MARVGGATKIRDGAVPVGGWVSRVTCSRRVSPPPSPDGSAVRYSPLQGEEPQKEQHATEREVGRVARAPNHLLAT